MPHVIRSHWPPVLSLAVGLALLLWLVASVGAHDHWLSQGGHKNAAGEFCCGEGVCFVLPSRQVKITPRGYKIWLVQTVNGREGIKAEIVPYAEAQPSPDGAFWRCKRPDGSRRCFFAPRPNT